ncbi:MAG: alpha/beta hydrolase [Rhizobacter sp.]|nr:alpha/beta hydrolase [Ferruginibacter sp.]
MIFQDFKHGKANVNGIRIHYRIGGSGQPLLLIHGWPQHSLMWHTIAPILAEHFTVITPDLRGAGGSSIPINGYDKKTMAGDIYELIKQLGYDKVFVAGYDLGSGVAYSLAAMYPELVEKLAVMEFGLPGFGYETLLTATPEWNAGSNWHLSFFTVPQVAEFAFTGKERELLTWFFWHLSHNESAVNNEHFEEYLKQITKPGALRAGIEYYAAVWIDKANNEVLAKNKLIMPLLAVGGESSSAQYVSMLFQPVAKDITACIVPEAGHWLGDENPVFLADQLNNFFKS